MIKVYALGVMSPSKSQLLAMVDIIRAEELHQRSIALMNDDSQSPHAQQEYPEGEADADADAGSDSSSGSASPSPVPLKDEQPESPSSNNSETSGSSPPSPRTNSSGNQSTPESEVEEDTAMQDTDAKEEEEEVSPVPSPLSSPRQPDIDSPLHQLQQCNSTNVRSFLTNFRSCPPPLSHMNFSQSDPGHWPHTTGRFFPLSRRSQSQSHHDMGQLPVGGGTGRSARRQLDLGGGTRFGESESRRYTFHMDSEHVVGTGTGSPHMHLQEHSVSRRTSSRVTAADHTEEQSGFSSGLKTGTEGVATDTIMKNEDYIHASSYMPRDVSSPLGSGSTSASATSVEDDETELAINEHAKALLNLQALDDSVQAICDLDAPSKRRRVRSEEPDSGHRHHVEEAKEDERKPVIEPEPMMPSLMTTMEEDVMEGVTVERIRNWFKNRRYSAKKRGDRCGGR